MSQEHSQHQEHDADFAVYAAGDVLTLRESAEAANLWFPDRPPELVPKLASVSDLARALGVDEARARELVRGLRARLVQGEVEAVAAAIHRNRRRTPLYLWALLAVVLVLGAVALLGLFTVRSSVAPQSVVTEPAPVHVPDPPATPAGAPGP